jgi:hypothetical protein
MANEEFRIAFVDLVNEARDVAGMLGTNPQAARISAADAIALQEVRKFVENVFVVESKRHFERALARVAGGSVGGDQ